MFKIEFTKEELQQVVNVLAQRPFAEVVGIIGKIQQQASTQDTPAAPVTP